MKNIIDVRDYSAICHVSSALGALSYCSDLFARVLHEMSEDSSLSDSERVDFCRHLFSFCHSSLDRALNYISWYQEGLIRLENKIDAFAGSDLPRLCEANKNEK